MADPPPQDSNDLSAMAIILGTVLMTSGLFMLLTVVYVRHLRRKSTTTPQGRMQLLLPIHVARSRRTHLAVDDQALPLVRLQRSNARECALRRYRAAMAALVIQTEETGEEGRPVTRPVIPTDLARFHPVAPFDTETMIEAQIREFLETQGHIVHRALGPQMPPHAIVRDPRNSHVAATEALGYPQARATGGIECANTRTRFATPPPSYQSLRS